jgi:peptide/nickel transport system ATP-binding protein/oligopeptide transport system ATP-binding protein
VSLLEVNDLTKSYVTKRDALNRAKQLHDAVKHISFTVDAGETVALVGESGSGKTTTARLILRHIQPDGGSVLFEGRDLLALNRHDMRSMRQHLSMIFQDPYGCLDPRIPIGESVAEPIRIHHKAGRAGARKQAAEMLDRVGMSSRDFDRYPSELSGGQLQRVAIARSLTLNPTLMVADEPVAALDASVRAQVLNLMMDLQRELGLSYLFITHDIALVEVIADRVLVMQLGEIVESDTCKAIFESPKHEYTKQLLASTPVPLPRSLR